MPDPTASGWTGCRPAFLRFRRSGRYGADSARLARSRARRRAGPQPGSAQTGRSCRTNLDAMANPVRMTRNPFELNPAHDVAALARTYAAQRRLHMADFLAPGGAEQLLAELQGTAE